jgi:predicted metal-dependent enzyme (double-stranded beta helix superfamily)
MHIHAALADLTPLERLVSRTELFDEQELESITRDLARRVDRWSEVVRHDPNERWYELLLGSDALEVWLIGWAPGQATRIHDHGGAAGAMSVASGTLVETVFDHSGRHPSAPIVRSRNSRIRFSPEHIHTISNRTAADATSVHAYSPAGREMTFYDLQPEEAEPVVAAAG